MKCEQLGYMHIFNNEIIYRQPKNRKKEKNSQDRSAVEENETSV